MNPAASAGYSGTLVYRSGLNNVRGYLRQAADGSHMYILAPQGAETAPRGGARTPDKPGTAQSLPGERNVSPLAPGVPAIETPPGQFSPVPAPSVTAGNNFAKPGAPVPEGVYPPAARPPGVLRFGEAPQGFLTRPGFGVDGGLTLPGGAAVAMTALNESTFVVAHSAVGPGGEPAVMLTVYRLQGAQLRIVSKTLHRLDSGESGRALQAAPGGRLEGGSRPGTPGNPFLTPNAPAGRPGDPAAEGTGRVPAPSSNPPVGQPVPVQAAPVSPAPERGASSPPSAR
jgi:hypothetical protein